MDGALLQTKVYGGFAKAAARVGLPHDIYRPVDATNPLVVGNKIGTLQAAFTIHTAKNFNFEKPSDFTDPMFHALLDPTTLQVGDFIVPQSGFFGPFFIASKTPSMPVLSVQTNRTLSIYTHAAASAQVGNIGYSGSTTATETAIVSNWPASMLAGSTSRRDNKLPEDLGKGSFRVIMSAPAGVIIKQNMIVIDDLGNRLSVQMAELQDLGWRLDVLLLVN